MGNMSSTDKAMWKVAWLLSNTAGEIGKDECQAFKTLCFANGGMEPGSKEANEFLEEVVAEAENLRRLKIFYTSEELMRAFIVKVAPECEKLKSDPVVSRKAFAVWVGMCMADGEYTEMEKNLIRLVRQIFSPSFKLSAFMLPMLVMCPIITTTTLLLNRALKSQSDNIITDGFLEELEEDYRMLTDLKAQIDATGDEKQKNDLQRSCQYIEQSLNELIANGQNE